MTAAVRVRPAPPPPVQMSYYVPLPRRLAEDLRDSPLAIGVYCLIGRLYRISRAPVPLSPGDLQALDPSLSYGAATRALRRLAEGPFVVVTRVRGRKNSYAPAWGTVSGAVVAWQAGAPCLGRPRHVAELRLDQRLLDTCLGRLRPHAEHPAIVERYVAQPLLGLEEVGAYAAALAGIAPAGERLRGLGLLDGGRPLPLPDDATLLALASQRALGCGDAALTAAGWARTPFRGEEGPAAASPAQALFFVPPGQIGGGIGPTIADPIAEPASVETGFAASERRELRPEATGAGSHVLIDSEGADRSPTPQHAQAGGGDEQTERRPAGRAQEPADRSAPATPQPAEPPEAEGAQLLRALGVRRSVREQLRGRPREQVAQVIAQARARGDVRDLAGWVVSALRELPEEAAPAPVKVSDREILLHPGLTHAERSRWLTRFRGADAGERLAVLERFRKEHPDEQLA